LLWKRIVVEGSLKEEIKLMPLINMRRNRNLGWVDSFTPQTLKRWEKK
jgi:hypothetical protein